MISSNCPTCRIAWSAVALRMVAHPHAHQSPAKIDCIFLPLSQPILPNPLIGFLSRFVSWLHWVSVFDETQRIESDEMSQQISRRQTITEWFNIPKWLQSIVLFLHYSSSQRKQTFNLYFILTGLTKTMMPNPVHYSPFIYLVYLPNGLLPVDWQRVIRAGHRFSPNIFWWFSVEKYLTFASGESIFSSANSCAHKSVLNEDTNFKRLNSFFSYETRMALRTGGEKQKEKKDYIHLWKIIRSFLYF